MKIPTLLLTFLTAVSGSASAADWLHLPAKAGTANGRKVVLVSGDEEYRSEETCPMLAKILSQKFGYDCTVLFAINPDGGYIDSNYQKNIPGTESLNSADLLIIGTRFRQLPDDQLAPFAAYLNAGKPVMGFRTATHAFSGGAKTGEFKWSEFGLQILGEKWVAHHGQHGSQGTRSVVEPANAAHPLLKGVGEIFGPSDVYTVSNLTPAATLLLRGAVTETLDPASKNIEGPKNNPMMPLAWVRDYTSPDGKKQGKAFCTTMGTSQDFADEDLRRLFINAALHLTGQKIPDKADAAPVDPFEPTGFKNISEKASPGFYKTRNLKPADYALGKSPATGLPGAAPTPAATPAPAPAAPKKAEAKKPDAKKSGAPESATHAQMPDPETATAKRPQTVAPPAVGERIVLIGNGLAERDLYYNRIETELQLRYPSSQLFLRNMGRPGDTPSFRPHPSRDNHWAFPGAEKFRPEFASSKGNGFFPMPDQWLTYLQADTIVACFGYNESFDGADRVAGYQAELEAFVQHTLSKAYNGKTAPRLVLVSPIAYENQSAVTDLPNGEKENAALSLYTAAMEQVAKKHGLTFIDLFNPSKALYGKIKEPFTTSGFIPNDKGYQKLAMWLADGLYGPQARQSKADPALVHAAVKDKD